jgi:hypothetical protein
MYYFLVNLNHIYIEANTFFTNFTLTCDVKMNALMSVIDVSVRHY